MLRLIGLGKMGLNLFDNMMDHGIEVLAYDINEDVRNQRMDTERIVSTLEELVSDDVGTYWLMLPQGEITEVVFEKLCNLVAKGSVIIDGGNAHFSDSVRRYDYASSLGLEFLDVGVSGGKSGARYGACMMVGGDLSSYKKIEPILSKICVEDGYGHVGANGSGHYLKMIHNGIEYGMMQAMAEGFNMIENTDLYDYDLFDVSIIFNNGSVIRSWLMELMVDSFKDNPSLKNVSKQVQSSGEGKWTVQEALRLGLNTPVIAQSLFTRYASNDEEKFGERVTSSLRTQFGGHASYVSEE